MVRSVSEPTSLNIQTKCVEWKVSDILHNGLLQSGIFYFYGLKWELVLEKATLVDQSCIRHRISAALINVTPSNVYGTLSIQSFIKDSDTQKRHWKKVSFDTSVDSSKQIWEMEFFDSELVKMMSSLMIDGALTFIFCLKWIENQPLKEKDEQGVQAHMNAESETSAERLAVDFRRLLDDSTHSDVTLKSGDITIPAHRLILSARSEVFAAMLRSGMEESRTGVIEISDIDPPVLVQLVQFIYSGKLSDLSMETAPQLFVAGDMYAIETLKNQCSSFMKENLDEGNACSILVLADAHGDMDLRERGISFIIDTELTQKDDIWLRFCDDHPKLAIEVLNRNLKAAKSFK